MHFHFEPSGERSGGIRLIAEIPDYKICHLEGKNGAGKSLALRLLELISGEQPYATTPSAWSSLRENLGETQVTITGLAGRTLRVELKPERWVQNPGPVGEWLGDAFLDEKPIEITAIGSLLHVVRIAGDETFEGTIKRRLAAQSAAIERSHERFVKHLSQLTPALDELMKETGIVDSRDIDRERLNRIEAEITEVDLNLRAHQERISLLNEAMLARRQLTALTDQLPNIQERLEQLERESKDLTERLRFNQTRRAELLAEMGRGSTLEEQIQKIRQIRESRMTRLQRLARELQEKAAQLHVNPSEEASATALAEARQKKKQIDSELASAGHNSSVRDFTSRVARDLDSHRELEGEVVVLLNSAAEKLRVTGRDLRAGVQERQVELAEVEDDPLLVELRKCALELSRRIIELVALQKLIRDHERATQRLKESDAELDGLVKHAKAAGGLRAEYDQVSAELGAVEDELRQRISEDARLRVQLDQLSAGKSEEELSEKVKHALESLRLNDNDDLEFQYRRESAAADDFRSRLRRHRTEQLDLKRALELRAAEILQVASRLAAIPWLPVSIRQVLARGDDQQRQQALLSLRTAVGVVRESLYLVRDRFDKLVIASRHLAEEVGRRDRISSAVAFLPELAEEMGERLRSEFDQEEISSALFDGGELQSIDLRNLEAQWVTKDGELRSRPFEAFSSGERVFAYTRARIERVALIEAEYKVIALDEFGAFLARDRLERLASYLRDAVAGSIADQIIIVVPLAANYEAQAKVTSGDLGERFARRAAEIESRFYFAEDATERELV